MEVDKLSKDASNLNWDRVTLATGVDDKIKYFNDAILALYDVHAPIKQIKLKRRPAPWTTEDVSQLMRRRDRTFRKFKKNRT